MTQQATFQKSITFQTRTDAATFKATGAYAYNTRAVCACGYKGKFCPVGHAEYLAEQHDCNN